MGLIEVAGITRPKPGEPLCGDAWLRLDRNDTTFLAIIDGLGHGPEAARAAEVAVAHLHRRLATQAPSSLVALFPDLDEALHATRGAVAGLALIDPSHRLVHYAGIGNTEARIFAAQPEHLLSRAGFLGSGRRLRPALQTAPLPPGALLVLHTDGVEPPDPSRLPRRATCTEIAEAVLDQSAHGADDAAVVVARLSEE